ncbi:dTDP-4-dehydrorhamnose 3,5-epimerase [Oleispirillum naphthae]|uniref:dTDP-4-dehydrorhamnose 3,5-epimerase n=1 Tax=Oleispirillum naphthae TaxID=2838853 RepID=UPI00308257D4
MIDGVIVSPLGRYQDERGAVLKMLRADDPHFAGFGEIYFSLALPGAVKGWTRHTRATGQYAVPEGDMKIVLHDGRSGGPTYGETATFAIGGGNHALLTVPPGIWMSFAAIGGEPALLANCASLPHDPAESEKKPIGTPDIPFRW